MKRPHIVHFTALMAQDFISVKASLTMKENIEAQDHDYEIFKLTPKFPMRSFRQLKRYTFKLKLIGVDQEKIEIFKKIYESDSFGNFSFKIPRTKENQSLQYFHIYEISTSEGLEIHLGSYLIEKISSPLKIIISDFDKTLVDTKYHTAKEVIRSLLSPLQNYPTVPNSLSLILNYVDSFYRPFILSASPHFYEESINDWLYQNKLYTAKIFLKDYRQIFSLFDGLLRPRDLKAQILYKLNSLFDIILMTGLPDDLVLMGDSFESDPLIYLNFIYVLSSKQDARSKWLYIKNQNMFQVNNKQDAQMLNKIYQITNALGKQKLAIKVFIRQNLHSSDDQSSYWRNNNIAEKLIPYTNIFSFYKA